MQAWWCCEQASGSLPSANPGEIWSWVHGFEFPCCPKEVRSSLKLSTSFQLKVSWDNPLKEGDQGTWLEFLQQFHQSSNKIFSHINIISYFFSWVITVMAGKIPVIHLDSVSSAKPDLNFMSIPWLYWPYCFSESCSWQAEWKTRGCTN